MPRNKNLYKTIGNNSQYFVIALLLLLFILAESDRNFNGSTVGCPIDFYYIKAFPLPILGIYNTFIRTINPHHTHVFNVNSFTSDAILRNNWKVIQNEALNVYTKKNILSNMKDIAPMGNFDGIDKEKDQWKVFVLKWYDKPLENAAKVCPNSINIINKCSDVHAAMFSILEPGKFIPPHKGPSTGCLRYHLGLKIPKDRENCYIKVNNQNYHWVEGESLIFDDTYVHSVFNNTNEPRIILFIDIERPVISPIKEINRMLFKNARVNEFVKGVNDVSEKVKII